MRGSKPELKSMVWTRRKEHSSRTEWRNKNSKKRRESYKPLGQPEMFQYPNYRGARRRRTTARNWKLIWRNNEGKLPQSGEGNRLLGSPGSPESQRSWTQRGTHQGTSSLSYPRLNIRENPKRKGDRYLQRNSHKTVSWFLKRNLAGKKGLERSIPSHERQGPTSKMTLSGKAII